MKIAFGMIVFNGDYVLQECLEQIYPFASQILIAEGPVRYWQRQGYMTSNDKTNMILDTFHDPDKKMKVIHSRYSEKDDQSNAYMQHINEDIDYLWMIDSDEIYKTDDIIKMIQILEQESPTSVGVRSCSFYGGIERYLTGFELKTDNFIRIFKYEHGCTWESHRPPKIKYSSDVEIKHINSDELYKKYNIQMYHYSYVFPTQVYQKVKYYKSEVSRENCIDNYFEDVYLKWITNNPSKLAVEYRWRGVHEWNPNIRGDCFTEKFDGTHPESIEKNKEKINIQIIHQLQQYLINNQLSESDRDILYDKLVAYDVSNTWDNHRIFDLQSELNIKQIMQRHKYPEHWFNLLEYINQFHKEQPINFHEIGCGSGVYYKLLKDNYAHINYSGTDSSQYAIEKCIENWGMVDKFSVKNLWKYSEEDISKYDIIYLCGVLEIFYHASSVLLFLLSKNPKKLLINRMNIGSVSNIEEYIAYDTITAYKYTFSLDDLQDILKQFNYQITYIKDKLICVEKK